MIEILLLLLLIIILLAIHFVILFCKIKKNLNIDISLDDLQDLDEKDD